MTVSSLLGLLWSWLPVAVLWFGMVFPLIAFALGVNLADSEFWFFRWRIFGPLRHVWPYNRLYRFAWSLTHTSFPEGPEGSAP